MDPLSITTACISLLGAVIKTSLEVTAFIRGCREARSGLTSISGELTQLQLVLDPLKDDASVSNNQVIPESLQAQILSIIRNCSAVIGNLNAVLHKHSGKTGVAKWVAFGKGEVAGLRMSLEAHRGSRSLVLELVTVSMSNAIMDGMDVVRSDVHDIKQDTRHVPEIMAELTRLRAIVTAGAIPMATSSQNHVLEQYLDSLTSYAETVCNDVVWDSDGSRHTLSQKPSCESVGDSGDQNKAHALPTAQPSEVATGQHKKRPWIAETRELEAKCGVAPLLAIPSLDEPKLADIGRAPSTSGEEVPITKHFLIVGDHDIGKSMIYNAFLPPSYKSYPEKWRPPVYEDFIANLKLGGRLVKLSLHDFYFPEQYHSFKTQEYRKSHAILMCYAVDSPDSLGNAIHKSFSQVHLYCGSPIILVSLNKDRRKSAQVIAQLVGTGQHPVTYEEGELVALRIGAVKHLECSFKTSEDAAGYAIKLALGMQPESKFWPPGTELLPPGAEIGLPESRKTRKDRLSGFLRKIAEKTSTPRPEADA